MAWILSSLPALLAALTALWAVIGPWITNISANTLASSPSPMSSEQYNLYFYGQGAVAAACSGICMLARPTANRMYQQDCRMMSQQAHAARAAELRDEIELLPMAQRNEFLEK